MKKITISNIIGLFVEPYEIRRQLEEANGEDIVVEISTPGGFFSAGLEIFNMLKNYSGQVSIHLMGVVASMGTYIALARGKGGRVTAEDNAVFMIHNAQQYVGGDHNTLRKQANIIESLSGILAKKYEEKTGQNISIIKAWMDEEKYFFGQEIMDAGFVDEITEGKGDKEKTTALAIAKTTYTDCILAMAKSEKAISDLENVAAMGLFEGGKTTGEKPVGDNNENGLNQQRGLKMADLNKLIKEDPEIAAQVQARDAEQFQAGKTKGIEEVNAKIKKVSPFLNSESTYPNAVRNLAVAVLAGEKGIDALDGAVTVLDAQIEAAKALAAKNETNQQKETTGQQGVELSADGSLKSDADYQAAITDMKKALGNGGVQ